MLDASVALAWIFERVDATEAATANAVLAALAQTRAVVPELWHLEVMNSLLVGIRRGVLAAPLATDFLGRLKRLPIVTDPEPVRDRADGIFMIAQQYDLTAYDATYLDLAIRLGASLVTFDGRLARAQARAGVKTA